MPNIDGIDFLKIIREEKNLDIPFIMFTGKGREEVAIKALNLGADRYLRKGGDPKSQYRILAETIVKEYEHYRSNKERKELRKQLRASLKKYRKMIESSPNAIFLANSETGKIIEANSGAEELLNMGKEKIKGMHQSELHPDNNSEKYKELFKKAKEEEKVIDLGLKQENIFVEDKDGKKIPVEVDSTKIQLEDQELLLGIFKDITETKERQKKLNLFKIGTEKAPESIFILNKDAVIKFVNENAVKKLEYSQEELLEMKIFDIDPNFEPDNWENHWKKVKEEGRIRSESKHETKDGSEIPVELIINHLEYEGEEYHFTYVRYRTEKDKLEGSEERFRRFFADLTEPAFLTNLEGDILEANEKATKELGYSKDELKNMNVAKEIAIDKEAHEKHQERLERLKNGETLKFKSKLQRKDGSVVPVEAEVSPIFLDDELIVGSIERNISELERTKKKLRKESKKMQQLHNITADMETVESKKKACELAVKAAEEILDFEVCGIDLTENNMFVPKAMSSNVGKDGYVSRPIEKESLGTKTYKESKSFLIEDLRENKAAEPVKEEYRSAISVPIGDQGIFQAISDKIGAFDKKDLEMAEILASHVNEALERIEAGKREEFLHSLLRHDLRNKAQTTVGYLQLLKDTDISEKQRNLLKKALKSTQEGSKLIKKVRTLRKLEKEELIEQTNPNSLINEAITEHKEKAKEKEIEIQFEEFRCKVKGGPLLKELFSNLIENAIIHSNCDKIRITSSREGEECIITVEDDGNGIPDGEKEKIFTRGYKSERTGGSGLGMYLVKRIVKNYNGRIEAKDSDLNGARFDIFLKTA